MFKLLIGAMTTWQVPVASDEELAEAGVILSHEFGNQKKVSRTTAAIAKIATALSRRFGLPWIAQFPGNLVSREATIVIFENDLDPDFYLQTNDVSRQCSRNCSRAGWKTVIVITHPHHAWRAGKNLERYGLKVIFPDLHAVAYDPHNARKALSSAVRFVPREVFARIWYLFRGYV